MKNLIELVSRRLAKCGRTVPAQEIKRAYWRGAKQRNPITGLTTEMQALEIVNYLNFNQISKPINQNSI